MRALAIIFSIFLIAASAEAASIKSLVLVKQAKALSKEAGPYLSLQFAAEIITSGEFTAELTCGGTLVFKKNFSFRAGPRTFSIKCPGADLYSNKIDFSQSMIRLSSADDPNDDLAINFKIGCKYQDFAGSRPAVAVAPDLSAIALKAAAKLGKTSGPKPTITKIDPSAIFGMRVSSDKYDLFQYRSIGETVVSLGLVAVSKDAREAFAIIAIKDFNKYVQSLNLTAFDPVKLAYLFSLSVLRQTEFQPSDVATAQDAAGGFSLSWTIASQKHMLSYDKAGIVSSGR
jgi:hypothetical protein